MKTYQVTAKRWEHGWELHINGVGVTQTKSLSRAAQDARDYVSMVDGKHEADIKIVVTPQLDEAIAREVRAARDAVAKLAQQQRAVAEVSRDAVHRLSKAGLTGKDIAAVLDVSPQRISQLLGKSATAAAKEDVTHRAGVGSKEQTTMRAAAKRSSKTARTP